MVKVTLILNNGRRAIKDFSFDLLKKGDVFAIQESNGRYRLCEDGERIMVAHGDANDGEIWAALELGTTPEPEAFKPVEPRIW
jgi:hypothetical protein